jgi:hypothetical protein
MCSFSSSFFFLFIFKLGNLPVEFAVARGWGVQVVEAILQVVVALVLLPFESEQAFIRRWLSQML